MANDRIYIRCKGCKDRMLLAKYWGGGELGPVLQFGARLTPEHQFTGDETEVERLDTAHEWLETHLRDCREGYGMDLDDDCGFALVTEGEP